MLEDARPPRPEAPLPFGRFELLELVGEGAMAQVFRARRRGPMGFSKEVAIKRLRTASAGPDRKLIESLINEARISGRLRHPRIVEVFEFDEVDGDFFLAMEFVHGWTLDRVMWRIHEVGQLPPPGVVVDAARQIADALAYAHTATDDRGQPLCLVHRDLKPQNLFLDRTGAVKIADFGLAKSTQNLSQTRSSEGAKGSPLYMSPEQIAGHNLDGRSDLFAVGVVIVEMATGLRAFEGNSIPNTLLRVLQCDSGEALAAMRDVAPVLHPVVSRLLRRGAQERYPGARELLADLDAIANYEPVGLHTRALVSALMDEDRPGVPQRVQEGYSALRLALRSAGRTALDAGPGEAESLELEAESAPAAVVLPRPGEAAARDLEAEDTVAPARPQAPPPPREPPTQVLPAGRAQRQESRPDPRPPPALPLRATPGTGPITAAGQAVGPGNPVLPLASPTPSVPVPVPEATAFANAPTVGMPSQARPPVPARPPEPPPAEAGPMPDYGALDSVRPRPDASWGRVYALLGVAIGLAAFLLILLQLSPRPPEAPAPPAPVVEATATPRDVPEAPLGLVQVERPPLGRLWQDLPIRLTVTEPGPWTITCHYRGQGSSGPWRRVALEPRDAGRHEVLIPLTATFGGGLLYYLELRRETPVAHWRVGSPERPLSAAVR